MSGLPASSLLTNTWTTMQLFELSFAKEPWPILQALAAAGLMMMLEKRVDSGKVIPSRERGLVTNLDKNMNYYPWDF